ELNEHKWDPPAGAEFESSSARFNPHVLCVRTGEDIIFRRKSRLLDHFHFKAKTNPELNLGAISEEKTETKSFKKPEIGIPVHSDINHWLSAYICVFDHPFFAVSKADGSFQIDGLPPGK